MNTWRILEMLQETDEQLQTLMGLMDMVEVFGESQTNEFQRDYIGHISRTVKRFTDDMRSRMDEVMGMLMQDGVIQEQKEA